jgi:predicted ATPase
VYDSLIAAPLATKARTHFRFRLKEEEINTNVYMDELKKITERMKVRCIYIYSYATYYDNLEQDAGPTDSKSTNTPPDKKFLDKKREPLRYQKQPDQ